VFFKMKQYESALQECQIAVRVHPVSPIKKDKNGRSPVSNEMIVKANTYYLTATVYGVLGNTKMALESVSSAIDLNEFDGYFYIDRAAYNFGLMKIFVDTDTQKIISLDVDSTDTPAKIVEDLQKASLLLKNDEDAKETLKIHAKGYIKFFSDFQEQDATVQTILAKLKKLE